MRPLTLTLPLSGLVLAIALSAGGPALAQSLTVAFSAKDDFVYLDVNNAAAAAPVVRLACEKGQGRVKMALYEARPADQSFSMVSGAATGVLDGKKSSGARGDFVKSEIFAVDKIMLGFRATGQLEIKGDGFRNALSIADTGKPAIERFFVGCEEG